MLQTAEREKAIRAQTAENQKQLVVNNSTGRAEKTNDGRSQVSSDNLSCTYKDLTLLDFIR